MFIAAKKLDNAIHKKCEEIVCKIALEIQEVFKKGRYSIGLDIATQDKVVILIVINKQPPEKIECGYDILYSEASLLIELRNVKDVLYKLRKTIDAIPVADPWWKRLLNM